MTYDMSYCPACNNFGCKCTAPSKSALLDGSAFSSEREKELFLALKTLCYLKRHKDLHGKTELYNEEQPGAWKEAMRLVGM